MAVSSDTSRWLRRLAELPPRIHDSRLPAPGALRRYTPEQPTSYQPPNWARYPKLWERAAEISQEPAPALPGALAHLTSTQATLLRRWGTVSGLVDCRASAPAPQPLT